MNTHRDKRRFSQIQDFGCSAQQDVRSAARSSRRQTLGPVRLTRSSRSAVTLNRTQVITLIKRFRDDVDISLGKPKPRKETNSTCFHRWGDNDVENEAWIETRRSVSAYSLSCLCKPPITAAKLPLPGAVPCDRLHACSSRPSSAAMTAGISGPCRLVALVSGHSTLRGCTELRIALRQSTSLSQPPTRTLQRLKWNVSLALSLSPWW